jgi:hypothetical protein
MNIKYLFPFLTLLCLLSCSKSNRFEIDTSKIDLDLKIERFDRDLMNMDTTNMPVAIAQMQQKYGIFFTHYCTNVIGKIGDPSLPAAAENLKEFLADSLICELYSETQTVFSDISPIEKEVNEAFKYVKHYFPDRHIPRFCTHISSFWNSYEVTPDFSFLSVSLDCYLGADFAMYQQLENIYAYQLRNMVPEKVAPDFLKAYLIEQFGVSNHKNLLEGMINIGKILYLQSIFMPQYTENEVMDFTSEQLEWCQKHEKEMWNYLLENKQLYETQHIMLIKYLNPAPFTVFFSQESPGQAALWLGLQIVKNYMDNNPDITLPELMQENNAQRILELSKYRP